jgi:hypothetical protein
MCFLHKSFKFYNRNNTFFALNFKNATFGPIDNFKQVSKQKRMAGQGILKGEVSLYG